MIFILGPLPDVPEFSPDATWTLVKEPSLWGFQFRAIPVAFVTTVLLAGLWILLTPIWPVFRAMTFPLPIANFVACLGGVLIVHELIHALVHPGLGVSKKTLIGFWPSRMFVYTMYVGELSRRRCLTILALPFVFISVVPLLFGAATSMVSFWLAYISILNGLLACGDISAIFLTLRQIPRDSIIRSKGWTTFYKPTP